MQQNVLDPLPPDVLTEPETAPLPVAESGAATVTPSTPSPTHTPDQLQ